MEFFKIDKKVKLSSPVMLAGWPGVGNVGKIAIEYLIQQLKAEKIATLYSPYLPHEVLTLPSGEITMLSNGFYYAKINTRSKTKDIIFVTGDTQPMSPEGQYALNEEIVSRFVKLFKGHEIYTFAGYNDGRSINKRRIFVAATSKDVIKSMKKDNLAFESTAASIWGSAGLVVAFAKEYGIPGACIMAETNGTEFDAEAAKRVLEFIEKRIGIHINMGDMQALVEETNEFAKKLAEQEKPEISFPDSILHGNSKPTYIH